MATAEGLADWLASVAGSTVVVDLSELSFLDSSGITALVMARNRMAEDGNELVLTQPHPLVRRTFEVTGLTSWLVDWDPRLGATSNFCRSKVQASSPGFAACRRRYWVCVSGGRCSRLVA